MEENRVVIRNDENGRGRSLRWGVIKLMMPFVWAISAILTFGLWMALPDIEPGVFVIVFLSLAFFGWCGSTIISAMMYPWP